jgi:hypothetical protein
MISIRDLLCCLLCITWSGSMRSAVVLAEPDKYALIVSSVSGDEEFKEKFSNWSTQMAQSLTQELGFSSDNVCLLLEDPAKASALNSFKATKVELLKSFDRLASKTKTGDLVFVFFLGHGSFDNNDYRFNLVGPDITGSEIKAQLERLGSQEIILICATPCSGILTRTLSKKGRIVITATKNEFENNTTQFAQFFVEAFAKNAADIDKSGSVSLLDAYLYAAKKVDAWYKERKQLATEHSLLEDNGDGVGTLWPSPANGEGLLASKISLGVTSQAARGEATTTPELQALYVNKQKTETAIQDLKYKKSSLSEAEYNRTLETLLVQLAQTNQKIKNLEKK